MQSASVGVRAEEFRPFHETIVEDIRNATNERLRFIASQLKKTVIPANHDAISEVWDQRRKWMGWAEEDDLGVPASLLRQKENAKAKASSSKSSSRERIEELF